MEKLILMCGVSGSGKSTLAHDLWKESPRDTVIVSRDKIRELLFGYNESSIKDYYKLPNINSLEKTVSEYQDALILRGLNANKKVIVDNTHLKFKYIKHYKKFGVKFRIVLQNPSDEIVFARNSNRVKVVGEDIIKRQMRQLKQLTKDVEFLNNEFVCEPYPVKYVIDQDKHNNIILFDIDGTLAHNNGRSPYDWNNVDKDTVDFQISDTLRVLKQFVKIGILSGRDGKAEYKTKQWLSKNDIEYDEFMIRKEGDTRPDYIIKEEMWDEIDKDYNIIMMFDDRRQVIDHARSLGIKVLDVANNTF